MSKKNKRWKPLIQVFKMFVFYFQMTSIGDNYIAGLHKGRVDHIVRTRWSRVLKPSMYTSYEKRKKPIIFKVRPKVKVTGPL